MEQEKENVPKGGKKEKQITHASVFSGIGAPEIAADMLGWKNLFHCEINMFGKAVLDYHYPESKSYEDITKTDFSEWRGKVTVLTGGFPCQPFSSAALSKSDPLGLLARMLLESQRWHSPVKSLRWEVQPICSRKVIRFTNRDKAMSLTKSSKILSESVIKSNRLLFRLVPSEHPTDETESSSSHTGLLKTPHPTNKVDEKGRRWTEGAKASHSMGLADLAGHGLLPTPTAMEGEKYTNTYNPISQMGKSLSAMAGSGLLPTPRANKVTDCNLANPKLAARNHSNLEEKVAEALNSLKTDGETFRLSPLFTEEMMGFPLMWTALPFLSRSGERNP